MGSSRELREQAIEWDLHETTEIAPLEFTEELKPELYGLELSEATNLVGGIDVIKHELEVLKNAYIDVIKLEITAENLSTFKDLRKNFTKNRTSAEKLRKAKKSYFLNGGRFVDAIFKNIDAERDLMESKLLEAEKFFENLEKEKKAGINAKRIEIIRPYVNDVFGLDFSDFDDESFDDYVLGKKTRFENEVKAIFEAELLAEAERLAETERQKAIEVENAKLKSEAEAKEKAFQKEREQAENERQIELAKQKAIQDQKDAEIEKLKADQIAKDKAEAIEKSAADKLAKAPIKKQLTVWVESFDLPSNQMLNNDVANEITFKFEAFKKWALTQVNNL
jgi:colicin import membrane protein